MNQDKKYKMKGEYGIMNVKVELISKSIVIINVNDSSNPYDKSDVNKTKIKERITKMIKVLLMCVVITTIIIEIIKY